MISRQKPNNYVKLVTAILNISSITFSVFDFFAKEQKEQHQRR